MTDDHEMFGLHCHQSGWLHRPGGWPHRLAGRGAQDGTAGRRLWRSGVLCCAVDVLILGRKTFETVWGFPEWPYGEKRVVVLSQTLHQLPADCSPSVQLTDQSPAEIVRSLKCEFFQHAYVDGSSTIQSFLAAGLVSDLTITTIPILLGSGQHLFGPLPEDLPLLHEKTQVFPNGFVQSKYRVG